MEFDFSKTPMANLWLLAKTFNISTSKIFKRYHVESKSDDFYIVLKDNITDRTKVIGDGKGLMRVASCDILLVSKSAGANETDLFNVNRAKIETALKNSGLVYSGYYLGYDGTYSQYTWEVSITHV